MTEIDEFQAKNQHAKKISIDDLKMGTSQAQSIVMMKEILKVARNNKKHEIQKTLEQ